jgi:hypothetical protein
LGVRGLTAYSGTQDRKSRALDVDAERRAFKMWKHDSLETWNLENVEFGAVEHEATWRSMSGGRECGARGNLEVESVEHEATWRSRVSVGHEATWRSRVWSTGNLEIGGDQMKKGCRTWGSMKLGL